MVLFRYFDRVEVYFLPVGHTHGQIDQMFSCLSKWLKRYPASTLEELQASLYECYNNPKPRVTTVNRKPKPKRAPVHGDKPVKGHPVISEVVDDVVDVDSWLHGLEIEGARRLYQLHGSHALQLTLDSTRQKVILKTKQYADNQDWLVCILVSIIFLYVGTAGRIAFFRSGRVSGSPSYVLSSRAFEGERTPGHFEEPYGRPGS